MEGHREGSVRVNENGGKGEGEEKGRRIYVAKEGRGTEKYRRMNEKQVETKHVITNTWRN